MLKHCFIAPKYRRHGKFVLFCTLLAFVVIVLGAYTRLTDAGLSCPDWPHCYGYLTAPHTLEQIQQAQGRYPTLPVNVKKAWTEMTHRYVAGVEGLLILIISASLLLTRKAKDIKTRGIAFALISLLILQVLLGMLTVTEKLKPFIVSAHLLTGLSLLGLLWWTYLDLQLRDDFFIIKRPLGLKPWLWLGFLLLTLQVALGGWVSSHYAGLACIDFPYCNGQWLPPLKWQLLNSDLITIHMLHRIGAVITGIYLLGLGLRLLVQTDLQNIGIALLGFLAMQVLLGVLNIVWLRPVHIALLHHMTAGFLLLTLITGLVKTSYITNKRYGSLFA